MVGAAQVYLAGLLARGRPGPCVAVELGGTRADFVLIILLFIKVHTARNAFRSTGRERVIIVSVSAPSIDSGDQNTLYCMIPLFENHVRIYTQKSIPSYASAVVAQNIWFPYNQYLLKF